MKSCHPGLLFNMIRSLLIITAVLSGSKRTSAYYMSIDLDHQSNLRGNLAIVREDVFGDDDETAYPTEKGRCQIRFNSRLFVSYCKETGWIAMGRTKQFIFTRKFGENTYDRWVR